MKRYPIKIVITSPNIDARMILILPLEEVTTAADFSSIRDLEEFLVLALALFRVRMKLYMYNIVVDFISPSQSISKASVRIL